MSGKIQESCMFFNAPSGCSYGARCHYKHQKTDSKVSSSELCMAETCRNLRHKDQDTAYFYCRVCYANLKREGYSICFTCGTPLNEYTQEDMNGGYTYKWCPKCEEEDETATTADHEKAIGLSSVSEFPPLSESKADQENDPDTTHCEDNDENDDENDGDYDAYDALCDSEVCETTLSDKTEKELQKPEVFETKTGDSDYFSAFKKAVQESIEAEKARKLCYHAKAIEDGKVEARLLKNEPADDDVDKKCIETLEKARVIELQMHDNKIVARAIEDGKVVSNLAEIYETQEKPKKARVIELQIQDGDVVKITVEGTGRCLTIAP